MQGKALYSPFVVLVVCVCSFGAHAASSEKEALATLPDYLQDFACKKSLPNYEECLMYNIERARPYFMKGIKELNVPPLDPLEISHVAVNRSVGDAINLRMVYDNIVLTGIKDTELQRIKADPNKMRLEFNALVPKLHITLNFDIQGQVFGNDLNMQGGFEGNFTDVAVAAKISGKLYAKEEVDYITVDKLNIKVAVGDGHIKIAPSDPNQQSTADFAMQLFNSNPRGMIDAIVPIALAQSSDLIKQEINNVLATVPAVAFLPDRK